MINRKQGGVTIVFLLFLLSFYTCTQRKENTESTKKTIEPIDTVKTISSLKKLGNHLYEITYYGDFTKHLEDYNKVFIKDLEEYRFYCSIFSVLGDTSSIFLGRSFDNGSEPNKKHNTLVCRYSPPNGYSSISLMRMDDIGFSIDSVYENLENYEKITNPLVSTKKDIVDLSIENKLELLNAAYHTPDGINEKGLVVALANYYPAGNYNIDSKKDTISFTYLVRKILDNCKNIEEAIEIIKAHNVVFYCESNKHFETSEVHLMISDASGNSIVAEVYDGEFRFIKPENKWQIITNSRIYNLSEEEKMQTCFRYDTLQRQLLKKEGKLSKDESLVLLKSIGFPFTQWSAVYDISNKKIYLAIEYNFDQIYELGF